MMRAMRAAAFGLAEGVRMYVAAVKGAPGDPGELRRQARPHRAELVRAVESGGG